jgi:hypothetical protein
VLERKSVGVVVFVAGGCGVEVHLWCSRTWHCACTPVMLQHVMCDAHAEMHVWLHSGSVRCSHLDDPVR